MNRRAVLAGVVAALALAAAVWIVDRPPLVRVDPGDDLGSVLEAAPANAVVVLAAGEHRGSVSIDRNLTLRGEPASRVVAPRDAPAVLTVLADDVRVEGITTFGGSTGILVREVDRVVLDSVQVTGADLHGIEIVDASARLSAVEVASLRHPLAQGIEVRNADGRPDTVIEHSTVSGGMEGIVSHVAEVVIENNVVRDTTLRGVTVTEMSDGIVVGNAIEGATGAGLYCGDMSRCQFQDNIATQVAGDDDARSTAGWGLVVTYHASASTENDILDGAAGPTMASIGGRFVERSPLEPGEGLKAALPASLAVLAALTLVALCYLALRRVTGVLERRGASVQADRRGPAWLLSLALVGLGVQTFHMIEHALQLYRVRVDGIPSRGGIVGPQVEAEWVHFLYNTAVLLGFLLVVAARRSGWQPPGKHDIGDRLLLVGVLIQGYHAVEHSVKLAQHIGSGAKVNQGILGGAVDLVLLHFSINLAVYLAAVGACVAYAWGDRLKRGVERHALSYG